MIARVDLGEVNFFTGTEMSDLGRAMKIADESLAINKE